MSAFVLRVKMSISGVPVPLLDTILLNSAGEVISDAIKRKKAIDRAYNLKTAKILRRNGIEGKAERLETCGTVHGYYACEECPGTKKVVQDFCSLPRLCPSCARVERSKVIDSILDSVRLIIKDKKFPILGYDWRFITLTVKTAGHYQKAVANAIQGFSKIWKNDLSKTGAAAVRAVEFGPKNGNVHIHVLYYGKFFCKEKLSKIWKRYTGSYVVDICIVKKGNVENQVREICKYITKFTDVSNARLVEMWESVYRRRLVERYGLFRKNVLAEWRGEEVKKLDDRRARIDYCCPTCGGVDTWFFVPDVTLNLPPPKGEGLRSNKQQGDLLALPSKT